MKVWYAIQFVGIYLWEVVRSTAQLAWLVVKPRIDLRPAFVRVPLALESDFSRLLFACLVSMTPGTLSVALDKQGGFLLVHLLDSQDKAASVAEIKDRIEAPLRRIFND
jgi:multicomponent K+:H+ antiporter subunit E